MYGIRKMRRRPNGAAEIALAGILVLVIATIGGGYGMQDALSEPRLIQAYYAYFDPSMLVAVIELVRLDRQKSHPTT